MSAGWQRSTYCVVLAPNATTTNYYGIQGDTGATIATEGNVSQIIATPMIVNSAVCAVRGAPGVGKSLTFTLYKNGSPTAIVITLSNSAVSAQYTQDAGVLFMPGDTISWQSAPSGTPASTTTSLIIQALGPGFNMFSGSVNTNPSNSAVNYMYMGVPGQIAYSNNQATFQSMVPASGTITAIYAAAVTVPGGSSSWTITLAKNSSASTATGSPSATIPAAGTPASGTGGTMTVAAGDTICARIAPASTPTAGVLKWTVAIMPDTPGQTWWTSVASVSGTTAGTTFWRLVSSPSGSSSTTETSFPNIGPTPAPALPTPVWDKLSVTATAFYGKIDTAPGVGNTRQFWLRQNSVDSAITVSFTGSGTGAGITTANITNQTLTFPSPGTIIDLKETRTGTPVSAGSLRFAFVLVSEAPVGDFFSILC